MKDIIQEIERRIKIAEEKRDKNTLEICRENPYHLNTWHHFNGIVRGLQELKGNLELYNDQTVS